MTEGILLREMLADPLLQKFGVIIVDEAHERNILTDIVLGLLKKIMKVRMNLIFRCKYIDGTDYVIKKFPYRNVIH